MRFCRTATLAVPVLFLFLLFGCGAAQIDASKTQDLVKESAEKSLSAKVGSVDCPSGVEVDPGTKFSCTVHLSGGETETATLKIRNDDADLDLLYLGPSK